MRQKSGPEKQPAEDAIRDIRRATRRHFSAEEKIRVVLEGLRGEESIAELCRREGIASSMYYGWSKEFLEAGKRRLAGDTARAATSDEVKDLRREAQALKEVVADLTLENRLLKKSMTADGGDEGTVKLTEPRARGDEFWSRWASGDGACVGDLAPDSKAAVTRSAAGCSRCRFWIRDVKEVRDLIVNRQEPLRLPG